MFCIGRLYITEFAGWRTTPIGLFEQFCALRQAGASAGARPRITQSTTTRYDLPVVLPGPGFAVSAQR
jgi:hypothetical protein